MSLTNARRFCIFLVVFYCALHSSETKRGSSRGSIWGRPARRPSPSRPSTNYGWNSPSHSPSQPSYPSHPAPSSNYGWGSPARPSPSRPAPAPSRPAPAPSRPAPAPSRPAPAPSPGYGWNVPSRPSSPSNSQPAAPPSRPAPNYGWNSNAGKAPSVPTSNADRPPAYSPAAKPAPNYGWNAGASPSGGGGTQGTQAHKPWSVPGRDSPYSKQTAGNQQSTWNNNNKPAAPPGGGQTGWSPDVNKQVNTGTGGAQKPGWNVGGADQANKKNVGTQQNYNPQGPAKYPQQQYGPAHPGQYPSSYQPGYQPGTYGYQPQAGYHGAGGHTTIINNNNNYHTSYGGGGGFGYHAPPVFYPSYTYSYRDTGSTTLGFFLGYSLARLTTPTYHYYGARDSYRPVYDHYEVHHYYHNSQTTPKQTEVPPNNIAVCVGDSGKVCPPNTYALCTASGSILCVADATATVPCANEKQVNCVRSTVPCVNNATDECRDKKPEDVAPVNIPCIYTTRVLGNITFVNNTIILEQPPEPPKNATPVEQATNATASQSSPSDAYPNATITTLPPSVGGNTEVPTPIGPNPSSRRRRDATLPEKQFCVTIVAEPAPRKNLTENEILFNGAKNIFQKFAVKALGAD